MSWDRDDLEVMRGKGAMLEMRLTPYASTSVRRSAGDPGDTAVIRGAALTGRVDILDHFHNKKGCSYHAYEVVLPAIEGRQLKVLDWALPTCGVPCELVAQAACARGLCEILQWAIDRGACPRTSCVDMAACFGHQEVLWMLYDAGVPLRRFPPKIASSCLDFFGEYGTTWLEGTYLLSSPLCRHIKGDACGT